MPDPFYITTAIAYPNGKPHIGHAYEAIAADVIARFQRQMGRDVRFQTGTDEHGLKMAQKARELGVTPQELCDEMSQYFIDMCAKLNVEYDVFQRTTAPDHHAASQELWRRMEANDDLYLSRYEGWYSIRDEAYYDASELSDGEGGSKLSPQGTPVEWTVEESWFFRLSKYQEPLLKLFADHPEFLQPDSRRNEVIKFVEGGLRDLSVSRTSFDWGVKVPNSENHVMYVWVDALTNYLTGLGFPNATPEMDRFWPADLHLIGKDIVRFHAVYWPAFLMSAKLPLPKQVFGHGFLLARGEKMSKSLGNVVDPIELADRFGVDNLRYFLMREVSFGQDGSYSAEAIVTRCNAELANSFGNLAQRVLSLIFKNLDGVLAGGFEGNDDDIKLQVDVRNNIGTLEWTFKALTFSDGLDAWMRAVFACNQYVDAQAPWSLKKTDPARMQSVLATLFLCIRDLAIAIQPIIPTSAGKLLDQMGIPADERSFAALSDSTWYERLRASGFRLAQPVGIFPRLELPREDAA
jgi:methionyl-tRNA synthetase